MALLFLDSFDHYTDAADKYTVVGTGATLTTGRHGQGLSSASHEMALTPTSARCIVGGAWRIDAAAGYFYAVNALGHLNAMWTLTHQPDGAVVLLSDAATVEHARSVAGTLQVGQWQYIELDLTLSVVGVGNNIRADVARVVVDGALVINRVNLGPGGGNYPGLGASVWNRVTQGGHIGVLDDFYICDGAGPAPWNAPLGDVRIDVIRPNGAGALTQWTPTGAATNWDAVNDGTPDDDTTYVGASAVGLSDLYQMEDVSATLLGAQLLVAARRTDEAPASLTPLLRHAGTTTELPTRALASSYFYRTRDCFVTMPNGDPLTAAHMNALQAGIKRST